MVGGNFTPLLLAFLNNLETVKAVTLVFCSIQQLYIRDIRGKFGIPKLAPVSRFCENLEGGITDFRISGQSVINENGHSSRTSHDIDMKLGPISKLDKRNTANLKKMDDDVMSTKS